MSEATSTSNPGGDTAPQDIAGPSGQDLQRELLVEVRKVYDEMVKLNGEHVFGWNALAARVLLMQFLKGTFFALGSLVGATIIISALVYFLSQIEVIPIVGEWIRELNAFLKAHQ